MGCFVVNCMASGLPIPAGTKTKLLLVDSNRDKSWMPIGGCHIHEMFSFASWPINFTMDDYGGHAAFDEEEVTKQLSYIVAKSNLHPQKPKNEISINFSFLDFVVRGMAGLYKMPLISTEDEKIAAIDISEQFERIGITYYRKDIWDYLVELGKKSFTCKPEETELAKHLFECLEPFPEGLSKEELWDIQISRAFNRVPYGDFMNRFTFNLLKNGSRKERWQGETLIDITLTKEQQTELIKESIEMYMFVQGLEVIGQPIMPSISTAPQCAEYDTEYLTHQRDFHKHCTSILSKCIKKSKSF